MVRKGKKNTTKLASVERLPPSIPTKSSKEVKEISKYFKVLNIPQAKKSPEKIYAQAFKSVNNTKFSRLKVLFHFLRQIKLRIFKKSSMVAVSLNHILT